MPARTCGNWRTIPINVTAANFADFVKFFGYYEMLAHCLAAMLAAVICIRITRLAGAELIDEMMWYMRWHSYVLFFIYNIGICVLMVTLYNHSLKKRIKK